MAAICIFIGLVLAVAGIIIAYATGERENKNTHNMPPPLPPRISTENPAIVVEYSRKETNNASISRGIPPRYASAATAVNTNKNTKIGYGPRGLKPIQFPCCPCDKQRNVPGKEQLIFWDSGLGCYRCSRGHKFKINGKLF